LLDATQVVPSGDVLLRVAFAVELELLRQLTLGASTMDQRPQADEQ
jgi:hypothetical protein